MSRLKETKLSKEASKLIVVKRTQKGISRNELAERVGVSYSYIFCIETCRKSCISYTILKAISENLEIDINILHGEENQEKPISKKSFEEMFFSNEVLVEGRQIGYEQKVDAYDIFRVYTRPELSASKKLEYIISKLYGQKSVSMIAQLFVYYSNDKAKFEAQKII